MLRVCQKDRRKYWLVFKKTLIRIMRALREALFPTQCLACGSFFHLIQAQNDYLPKKGLHYESLLTYRNNINFSMLMATFLCPSCSRGFLSIESPICNKCGIMFKSREGEDHICGECIVSPRRFRIARASGVYDQAFMEVIHCFKYKGRVQLARPLGMLLFSTLIRYWDMSSIDIIMPVPLHIKRLKKRGFNQAFLLIKDWEDIARSLNFEIPYIQEADYFFIRSVWTEPQTGLGRKKRMANIKNAFSIEDSSKVFDKRILLVDDVYTTGATVDECAKILLRGGAKQVDVLTLARTM